MRASGTCPVDVVRSLGGVITHAVRASASRHAVIGVFIAASLWDEIAVFRSRDRDSDTKRNSCGNARYYERDKRSGVRLPTGVLHALPWPDRRRLPGTTAAPNGKSLATLRRGADRTMILDQ